MYLIVYRKGVVRVRISGKMFSSHKTPCPNRVGVIHTSKQGMHNYMYVRYIKLTRNDVTPGNVTCINCRTDTQHVMSFIVVITTPVTLMSLYVVLVW